MPWYGLGTSSQGSSAIADRRLSVDVRNHDAFTICSKRPRGERRGGHSLLRERRDPRSATMRYFRRSSPAAQALNSL
jgi:hypothetical protein